MIRNFINTVFRNFIRFKAFSFLNILGLSVGIAASLLILTWTKHEWSYDRFHDKIDRIHLVWLGAINETSLSSYGPGPLAPTLKSNYPEIENSARLWFTWRESPVRYKEDTYFGRGCGIEPEFFEIFTFHFKRGDAEISTSDPYFIILTEKFASMLLNEENPIGRTVEFEIWGRWTEFTVTGVIEDIPSNSTLEFDFLLPFNYMEEIGWDMQAWDIFAMQSYVLLGENASSDFVNEKVRNIIMEHHDGVNRTIHLQPFSQVHLKPMGGNG
ncbi:MAG: ABC transporter permease, partial [Bacteroidales bacterium]